MSWLVGTSITLHKEIISIEHNMVKIPTGRRQSSRLFTSEAEEAIEKQLQLAAERDLNPGPSDFKSGARVVKRVYMLILGLTELMGDTLPSPYVFSGKDGKVCL